jgi:prepilin-type processing-associated H-X9-DG protein
LRSQAEPGNEGHNECAPPNWQFPDVSTGQVLGCGNSQWWRGDACRCARSKHPGGVNIAMGDGSVHFASQTIDLTTWQHLGSRNDGQPVLAP